MPGTRYCPSNGIVTKTVHKTLPGSLFCLLELGLVLLFSVKFLPDLQGKIVYYLFACLLLYFWFQYCQCLGLGQSEVSEVAAFDNSMDGLPILWLICSKMHFNWNLLAESTNWRNIFSDEMNGNKSSKKKSILLECFLVSCLNLLWIFKGQFVLNIFIVKLNTAENECVYKHFF